MGNARPTLYVGVTDDLVKRVFEHKNDLADGFTRRYGLHDLLYYELFNDIIDAINREKQLKHWNREWKLKLIKEFNPEFKDLYSTIL